MKIKFTDAFVRSLKATGRPYSHGDTEHRGLMVRVRFLTFGQYGDMTLADASAAHAKARAALANGDDPQAAKVEAREVVKNAVAFREVRERFAAAVAHRGKDSAVSSTTGISTAGNERSMKSGSW